MKEYLFWFEYIKIMKSVFRIPLLILIISLASPVAVFADGWKTIILTEADGTKTEIGITDDLKIVPNGTALTITSATSYVEIPYYAYKSVSFSKTDAVHREEVGNERIPVFAFDGNQIMVTPPSEGKKAGLRLLNMSGMVIKDMIITAPYLLDLSDLPPAIYILSLDGHTIKFVNK